MLGKGYIDMAVLFHRSKCPQLITNGATISKYSLGLTICSAPP